MPDDPSRIERSEDLQEIWQAQIPQPFHMTIEEIHARAQKFQKRVRFRNIRESISCGVAFPLLVWWAFTLPHPIMRVGAAVSASSMLYVTWQLLKRGSSREITGNGLEFHRRELERQRDAVASVWRWYLGPFLPGPLIMTAGSLFWNHGTRHVLFVAGFLIVFTIFFWWVGRLNRRAAQCLQRQIDQLDELR